MTGRWLVAGGLEAVGALVVAGHRAPELLALAVVAAQAAGEPLGVPTAVGDGLLGTALTLLGGAGGLTLAAKWLGARLAARDAAAAQERKDEREADAKRVVAAAAAVEARIADMRDQVERVRADTEARERRMREDTEAREQRSREQTERELAMLKEVVAAEQARNAALWAAQGKAEDRLDRATRMVEPLMEQLATREEAAK